MGDGLIFRAQELAAATLAACDEFESLTGEATAAGAANHIYHTALPRPANGAAKYTAAELDDLRPFVLVSTDEIDGFGARRDATGRFRARGHVVLYFEMTTPEDTRNDWAQLEEDTLTIIGRIVARPPSEPETFNGLLDLAHGDGYLAIEMLRFQGLFRSRQEEWPGQGDWLGWVIDLEYGQP